MDYYICYKGRRLMGPLTREEAQQQLFELRGTFTGLYIQIVDPRTGKTVGEIPKKRKK